MQKRLNQEIKKDRILIFLRLELKNKFKKSGHKDILEINQGTGISK